MFQNRHEAGERLADAVAELDPQDPLVLALPRGGVPLGVDVAVRLGAPLDLMMVRKIGMPGQPEVAAGAIVDGSAPTTLFNTDLLDRTGLCEADFDAVVARLRAEIEARRARYLPGRTAEPVAGRTVVLVDDGIATGATVRAAIKALRVLNPKAVWVAVPVAPQDTLAILKAECDRVICLHVPEPFWSVGAYYRDFGAVEDEEVVRLLQQAWNARND